MPSAPTEVYPPVNAHNPNKGEQSPDQPKITDWLLLFVIAVQAAIYAHQSIIMRGMRDAADRQACIANRQVEISNRQLSLMRDPHVGLLIKHNFQAAVPNAPSRRYTGPSDGVTLNEDPAVTFQLKNYGPTRVTLMSVSTKMDHGAVAPTESTHYDPVDDPVDMRWIVSSAPMTRPPKSERA